jgi:hypothetical protein
MRARRTAATIALASIILAACGAGETATPAAPADNDPVPPAAEQPAPSEPAASGDDDAQGAVSASGDEDADAPTDDAALPPADDAADSEAAEEVDDSSQPEADPGPDPEPIDDPPSMAWPDDGCSADNSPTPTDLADGPAPLLELRPESAASPLPDVAVRRLNCNGGWVNFRNELPSELPLLVWFWAPH